MDIGKGILTIKAITKIPYPGTCRTEIFLKYNETKNCLLSELSGLSEDLGSCTSCITPFRKGVRLHYFLPAESDKGEKGGKRNCFQKQ
jgi:hypothetical protein